ncbi:MAG: hypothetical protein H6964_11220 [Chromatiaceae bacterium]|nr:hypothetical protein [Gammaproteobacteria bacterium]MCB1879519.1 hypothetical protein [Gammaproteobacteria bacterium]MCP5427611.1 hypothetical protein [Chromatiaceae bacterium]MCP5447552.1 hypothetical protein [Chromatiaceae bacterium]
MTCDEDLVLGRLLNVFVDICLLRAGPQDLPGSVFLVVLTALLSLLTGTLVIVGTFGSLDTALAAQLLDILLLLGLLRLVLQLTGKSARFLQTAAALFGSGALINLVTMPLQLLGSGVTSQGDAGELSGLFYLFLIIWALVIVAHIVRQALEVRMASGILISLAYFLIVNYVVQSLFTVV